MLTSTAILQVSPTTLALVLWPPEPGPDVPEPPPLPPTVAAATAYEQQLAAAPVTRLSCQALPSTAVAAATAAAACSARCQAVAAVARPGGTTVAAAGGGRVQRAAAAGRGGDGIAGGIVAAAAGPAHTAAAPTLAAKMWTEDATGGAQAGAGGTCARGREARTMQEGIPAAPEGGPSKQRTAAQGAALSAAAVAPGGEEGPGCAWRRHVFHLSKPAPELQPDSPPPSPSAMVVAAGGGALVHPLHTPAPAAASAAVIGVHAPAPATTAAGPAPPSPLPSAPPLAAAAALLAEDHEDLSQLLLGPVHPSSPLLMPSSPDPLSEAPWRQLLDSPLSPSPSPPPAIPFLSLTPPPPPALAAEAAATAATSKEPFLSLLPSPTTSGAAGSIRLLRTPAPAAADGLAMGLAGRARPLGGGAGAGMPPPAAAAAAGMFGGGAQFLRVDHVASPWPLCRWGWNLSRDIDHGTATATAGGAGGGGGGTFLCPVPALPQAGVGAGAAGLAKAVHAATAGGGGGGREGGFEDLDGLLLCTANELVSSGYEGDGMVVDALGDFGNSSLLLPWQDDMEAEGTEVALMGTAAAAAAGGGGGVVVEGAGAGVGVGDAAGRAGAGEEYGEEQAAAPAGGGGEGAPAVAGVSETAAGAQGGISKATGAGSGAGAAAKGSARAGAVGAGTGAGAGVEDTEPSAEPTTAVGCPAPSAAAEEIAPALPPAARAPAAAAAVVISNPAAGFSRPPAVNSSIRAVGPGMSRYLHVRKIPAPGKAHQFYLPLSFIREQYPHLPAGGRLTLQIKVVEQAATAAAAAVGAVAAAGDAGLSTCKLDELVTTGVGDINSRATAATGAGRGVQTEATNIREEAEVTKSGRKEGAGVGGGPQTGAVAGDIADADPAAGGAAADGHVISTRGSRGGSAGGNSYGGEMVVVSSLADILLVLRQTSCVLQQLQQLLVPFAGWRVIVLEKVSRGKGLFRYKYKVVGGSCCLSRGDDNSREKGTSPLGCVNPSSATDGTCYVGLLSLAGFSMVLFLVAGFSLVVFGCSV